MKTARARSQDPITTTMTVLVALVALVAIAAVGGCHRRPAGATASVAMVNPLTSGGVSTPVPLRIEDPNERQMELPPGALTDEAVLTSADNERICVAVTLRDLEAAWTQVPTYQLEVSSSNLEVARTGAAPLIEAGEVAQQIVPGSRYEQEPTGRYEQRCVESQTLSNGGQVCVRWRDEPIYQSVRYPESYPVYTASHTVCVPNEGLVSPVTEWVRVRLVDPANPRGGTSIFRAQTGRVALNFEWRFAR
jgi:hypothetical protein